jgi:NAD(P)-dependent dehydrogenase (short-subunit alcohol dehydrogenase family)
MAANNLVAFVIGAGPNVGSAVAAKLKQEGYKVAKGSRNPKAEEGYLPVKLDIEDKESVLSALDTVNKELGPVNVIVFNGWYYDHSSCGCDCAHLPSSVVAVTMVYPPKENDVLSLSVDDVSKAAGVAVNIFATAQAALASFRDPVHKDHPKAFIVTGNILPFGHDIPTVYWTLGLQKSLIARVIGNASKDYAESGIKFYFPSLVSKEGGFPDYLEEFQKSGPVHAKVYWDLINTHEDWDFR